jgi:DNA-binding response OmpR family regulator
MPDGMVRPDGFRVLAIDVDPALQGLLAEWLAPRGGAIVPAQAGGPAQRADVDNIDLILIDMHCPRLHAVAFLKLLAGEHVGTPVLALSSSFFPSVETMGAVARAMGVDGVLAKPVSREALVDAVDLLLQRE